MSRIFWRGHEVETSFFSDVSGRNRGIEKNIKKVLALPHAGDSLVSFWGEQKPVVAFAATGFNFSGAYYFLRIFRRMIPIAVDVSSTRRSMQLRK